MFLISFISLSISCIFILYSVPLRSKSDHCCFCYWCWLVSLCIQWSLTVSSWWEHQVCGPTWKTGPERILLCWKPGRWLSPEALEPSSNFSGLIWQSEVQYFILSLLAQDFLPSFAAPILAIKALSVFRHTCRPLCVFFNLSFLLSFLLYSSGHWELPVISAKQQHNFFFSMQSWCFLTGGFPGYLVCHIARAEVLPSSLFCPYD